jgi:hypothetical protein
MKYLVFIIITVIFTSCLTSLHPITNARNVLREDRMLGNWICNDEDIIRIQKFKESDFHKSLLRTTGRQTYHAEEPGFREDSIMYANGYNVEFNKNGVKYSLFGAITRIGGELYIDLLPIIAEDPKNAEGSGYEYLPEYLPAFSMAKLEVKNNNLVNLHFLNGDFIKEQIKNGNVRIGHEYDNLFETLLITASTEQLHQFFEKYGHDQRLFKKENSVTLTRKG